MEKKSETLLEPFRFQSVNNRGSILVVTLFIIGVLGIFSISLSSQVRQKISFAERIDRRELLCGIAQKGIQAATAELQKDDASKGSDIASESWGINKRAFKNIPAEDNAFFSVSYEFFDSNEGVTKIVYGVQDEEGKLNINKVKPKVLSTLLQNVADLDEDDGDDIAYGISDWRDSDSFASNPSHSAEDDDYEDGDEPYGAKDSDFQVLNELLLVRGMTYDIYEKIKDKLTVFGEGAVNINTASREVLVALGLDEDIVGKIFQFRSGDDGKEFTADDRLCQQPGTITSDLTRVLELSSGEVAAISNLVAGGLLTTQSNHFMIRSKGILKNKALLVEIIAVVERSGKTKFWFSGTPRRLEQYADYVIRTEVGENAEEQDN